MERVNINSAISVVVPLSKKEYKALEKIGEEYYTKRVTTVIKNIVRDEKKDFEEKNKTGIYVKYMDELKAEEKVRVNFDAYTNDFVRRYSKKIGVPLSWFVRFMILPRIEQVLQEGKNIP